MPADTATPIGKLARLYKLVTELPELEEVLDEELVELEELLEELELLELESPDGLLEPPPPPPHEARIKMKHKGKGLNLVIAQLSSPVYWDALYTKKRTQKGSAIHYKGKFSERSCTIS